MRGTWRLDGSKRAPCGDAASICCQKTECRVTSRRDSPSSKVSCTRYGPIDRVGCKAHRDEIRKAEKVPHVPSESTGPCALHKSADCRGWMSVRASAAAMWLIAECLQLLHIVLACCQGSCTPPSRAGTLLLKLEIYNTPVHVSMRRHTPRTPWIWDPGDHILHKIP